ncbi:MAG: GtrA family protein, partial [Spirochaetales bacterium]|nr:GtrA family protein [Spirochaetales bacterium]
NKLLSFFDIKLWKFLLVGVLNTIVGTGLQFVLYNLTGLKSIGQVGVWIASSISYFCGAVLSYFLNKYFTFKNTEPGWKPVIRFALNQVVCFAIAYGIAIPTISYICRTNQWTMFGWEVDKFASNVSMIIGSGLFVLLNYIGQRFYAFREKK